MKRTFGLLSLMTTLMVGAVGCGQMPILDTPETAVQAQDYASAERAVLRALRARYPGRPVNLDNLRRVGSPYDFEFTATVGGRRVTGTYDDLSGRVTVHDDDYSDPSNVAAVTREIRRELENRYPRAYVVVFDVRQDRFRDDFNFRAEIDSRRVSGIYNTTIRRLEIRDDYYNPPYSGDLGEIRRTIMEALRRRFPYQSITRFDMEAPNGTNYRFNVYIDGEHRFGYYDSTTRQVRIY